jgi:ADP-ribosyl-[dinitrogen reductase] hydrolase
MVSMTPAFALSIVGAGHCRGQISLSCCPGRAAAWLLPSVSQRELERDVGTVARWGAKALVSLLDDVEFSRLHLRRLPDVAASAELAWFHVPLAGGALPDAEFDRVWTTISLRLQEILREGGKVALHCRDGRERAALVTARLLIEMGCHPLDAMNRVRAARPGTLEMPEVESYLRTRVHAFKPEEFMQLALLSEDEADAMQHEQDAAPSVRRTPLRVAAQLRRS